MSKLLQPSVKAAHTDILEINNGLNDVMMANPHYKAFSLSSGLCCGFNFITHTNLTTSMEIIPI